MISVMYAGNENAFDGILISSMSLAKSTNSPINIYIMTMDLTEQNEKFTPLSEKHRLFIEKCISDFNSECSVSLIDVGDLYKNNLKDSPNGKTSYTPYTFLRLFADKIPSLPSKMLYLDADTVINKDISDLWNIDISNYEVAGALDYYGKRFMGRKYINAGVLLLNIEKIKETHLFDRVIELLNKKKVFLPDQTAINKLVSDKLIIDGKFNEQKHFCDDTVVQHFSKTIIWFPYFHTKNIKPWNTDAVKAEYTHKYDSILDLYTEKKQLFLKEDSK